MSADPDPDIGGADGGEVCALQILLAEMNEIGTKLDRLLPMIVDDENAPMPFCNEKRLLNLRRDVLEGRILDPQLNETRAAPGEPADPFRVWGDRIEGVEAKQFGAPGQSGDAVDFEEGRTGDGR